jgi:hypothetical protein
LAVEMAWTTMRSMRGRDEDSGDERGVLIDKYKEADQALIGEKDDDGYWKVVECLRYCSTE